MAERESFDAELPVIEAVRAGDRFAFGELVRRHDRWIRGVVFGVLGGRDGLDDVVQQAWTLAWQRIGELRDSSRWRPWLYRLARNAAIDAGRDATRRRSRFQALGSETSASDAVRASEGNPPGLDQYGEALAAVQGLPALYREPFVLRHLSGWSYAEIADVMGMPVDSVETRLVRARRLLRESLKGKV